MSHTKNKSDSPRFQVGDKVRVKYGVIDPDFPEMPLGGWTGTITEIIEHEGQINCVFKLDDRILKSVHPIYRKRCERDGLDFETMGLGEEDLELDDGIPIAIEQPTEIKTPPLSDKDQDDRVRMALGLTHDDPLPDVSIETLMTYFRYLVANLKFPFATSYWAESGPFSSKKVTVQISRLVDPIDHEFDEAYGLFCIGRDQDEEIEIPLDEIELKKKDPNYRLISDYSYWFHNWR
jgi:hypothetical protein